MSTKDVLVSNSVTLPCCACKGTVTFESPESTTHPTFFHTIPACERFDRTNTQDALLKYMRDCAAFEARS